LLFLSYYLSVFLSKLGQAFLIYNPVSTSLCFNSS
jgi:hypothetical protein